MSFNNHALKDFLDFQVEKYNTPEFLEKDPVQIPHLFTKLQDIEITGLLAAVLAWGQRPVILSKCKDLIARMDGSPHDFIINHTSGDLKNIMGFKHRTFTEEDALAFIAFLRKHYTAHFSLQQAFLPPGIHSHVHVGTAIDYFQKEFMSTPHMPHRTRKHIPSPVQKSACKRINMFLRWMVRKDEKGVDFGIWSSIRPDQLICPCDVHVDRVARRYNLITRKQTDWATAVELTENLRKFAPNDPVRYDFALFGLGAAERAGDPLSHFQY